MLSKEILRITNCIYITVISYFHLQSVPKSVSRKILGLKLVKLDCIIIYLDLGTIKKARNELGGACGLPLVRIVFITSQISSFCGCQADLSEFIIKAR